MVELQQNNPLHGLKSETMISELVAFYDWKILYAALRLECFNTNPNMAACVKFLKKTEWARERVENFYLYRFKRMPKGNSAQFELKPRERGFADGILPRKPQPLTVELVAEMKAKATADYEQMKHNQSRSYASPSSSSSHAKGSDEVTQRRNNKKPQPTFDPSNPWNK
ncbi:VF530 family protein [Shewanella sp. A14]